MRRLLLLLLVPLLAAGQFTIPSHTGATAGSAYVTPTYVASTEVYNASSVTTLTTPALTATAGDIFVGYCGVESSSQTFTFSSSPTNTINASFGVLWNGGTSVQMFVVQSAVAGSTTFTCSWSTAYAYPGFTVLQYHHGSLSTVDTTGFGTQTGTSFTTSSFSTTARGLIVVCGYPTFGMGTPTAGLIGGVTATVRTTANLWPACEDLTTSTSKTSITGAMSNPTSGGWLWAYVALK